MKTKKILILFCLLSSLCSTHVMADEAEWIETVGDAGRYGMPLAALFSALVERDWQGLPQLGLSLSSSLAVTQLLKETVREERPRDINSHSSFPSGHATWAFSSAGFIQRRYGIAPGIAAYSFASLVAYSRVRVGAHHTHDVLVGAAIGIAASYIFTSPMKSKKIIVEAKPYVMEGNQGLQMRFRW